jgi:hypothetical protein
MLSRDAKVRSYGLDAPDDERWVFSDVPDWFVVDQIKYCCQFYFGCMLVEVMLWYLYYGPMLWTRSSTIADWFSIITFSLQWHRIECPYMFARLKKCVYIWSSSLYVSWMLHALDNNFHKWTYAIWPMVTLWSCSPFFFIVYTEFYYDTKMCSRRELCLSDFSCSSFLL